MTKSRLLQKKVKDSCRAQGAGAAGAGAVLVGASPARPRPTPPSRRRSLLTLEGTQGRPHTPRSLPHTRGAQGDQPQGRPRTPRGNRVTSRRAPGAVMSRRVPRARARGPELAAASSSSSASFSHSEGREAQEALNRPKLKDKGENTTRNYHMKERPK